MFKLLSFCRREDEPPLENGWLPYLGLAFQFGSNPLEFLRSRQKKYGDAVTCKIAGSYFTFILDPFSYGAVFRNGKNLDFQKFAIETSRKVRSMFIHLLNKKKNQLKSFSILNYCSLSALSVTSLFSLVGEMRLKDP